MAQNGPKGSLKKDLARARVREALAGYKSAHGLAKINVRRQNSVSIRIRIIDPDFKGLDRVDRDTEMWKLLERLPERVKSQITMLLLLTPKEAKTSFANMEFEHPIKSAF